MIVSVPATHAVVATAVVVAAVAANVVLLRTLFAAANVARVLPSRYRSTESAIVGVLATCLLFVAVILSLRQLGVPTCHATA